MLSAAGLKASSACSSPVKAMFIVPNPFYFSTVLAILLWTKALNNMMKFSEQGSPKHRRDHFSHLHLLGLALQGNSQVI